VVPGSRERARQLRSDHAAPRAMTSVTLDFVVSGVRHRIWRQPRQEVARQRGSGTTVHQPKVLLFREAGGDYELLTNRLDECGRHVHDLLGMTVDQFCQVVLLPQGEFARFLRAEAKERQDLLERLFAAERYRGIETLLALRRSESAVALGELTTRVDRLLHQCAGEARLADVPDDADVSGQPHARSRCAPRPTRRPPRPTRRPASSPQHARPPTARRGWPPRSNAAGPPSSAGRRWSGLRTSAPQGPRSSRRRGARPRWCRCSAGQRTPHRPLSGPLRSRRAAGPPR
jgi:exonuclease SbcC